MSMNISGLGNTYNGINTNSKQYKALKEKGWLSGIVQNEAMMSAEERMIYESFGGRDTIINNLMKQFDSDGDLLNANGGSSRNLFIRYPLHAAALWQFRTDMKRSRMHRMSWIG